MLHYIGEKILQAVGLFEVPGVFLDFILSSLARGDVPNYSREGISSS
jgi:hypothetical protein